MLTTGIVGLPNVGKSTLFNALTSSEVNVSNYPFTTIDSNVGVVGVPDQRLEELSKVIKPDETTPYFIQFTDIAGLMRGASHGEGLGNQFLGNIREVDAIVQVLRCFQEADVVHVLGDVDPARDVDVVETELLLADLELMDRLIEKRYRTWKTSPRQFASEEARFRSYREKLAAGTPLRTIELDDNAQKELKGLGLLTGKPVLYVANVSEGESGAEEHPCVGRIRQSRLSFTPSVVVISARLESELLQLEPDERLEFIEELGLARSGLDRLIEEAYRLLNLITFYTVANKKLRAWAIPEGTCAPEAAGKVHTDMERGFIRAEVVAFNDLDEAGSLAACRDRGTLRLEGKAYEVRDGDVVTVRFSV